MHACMHAYIHAHIHTYIHPYLHTYVHTYVHTYIHTHIHTYIHTYAGDLGVPSGRPTMFFSVSFRETGLERQHMGPTPAYIFNDELGSFPQRRCSPNSVSANMVIPNPVMLFNSATMFQMPYSSSMNDAQIVPSNLVSTCKNRFLSPQSGT